MTNNRYGIFCESYIEKLTKGVNGGVNNERTIRQYSG
jgi:hypothetical protein